MRPTHYLSRRAVLAGLGTTAVAATLAACATSGSSGSKSGGAAGEGDASQVDVVTWWSAGSEKLGLDALVKVFNEQFPKTKFENKAVSGGAGSQAKQKLAADLAALGGATALNSITAPADPCAVAGGVARANGAALSSCAVTGEDVVVEVGVRVQVLGVDRTATAAARAGPVDAPGPGP